MGTTAVVIGILGAATAAGGTVYSAHQAKKAREEQADEEERRAEYEAERQAEAAERLKSRQRAAYAASGVRLEGTPLAVIEETQREAYKERQEILRRGEYGSDILRREGQNIWSTGMWNTAGTLLKGGSSIYETGKLAGKW